MNNATLSAAMISSCKQLESLREEQNPLFIWIVTAVPLLCFSSSTAVPSSLLGIAQVSPVTFAKFGAGCNGRKNAPSIKLQMQKERGWGGGGGGGGVGASEAEKRKKKQ